jgi:hypothetical protein
MPAVGLTPSRAVTSLPASPKQGLPEVTAFLHQREQNPGDRAGLKDSEII